MPSNNQLFFRLLALKKFLSDSAMLKTVLLEELITHATNPTIRMRRFRMLAQLSLYEHQIIQKIELLETDDCFDFIDDLFINTELNSVVSRNA